MKKVLSVLLIVSCLSFCACSSKNTNKNDEKNDTAIEQKDDGKSKDSEANLSEGYLTVPGGIVDFSTGHITAVLDINEKYSWTRQTSSVSTKMSSNYVYIDGKLQEVLLTGFSDNPITIEPMDTTKPLTVAYRDYMDTDFIIPNDSSYTTLLVEGYECHITGKFTDTLGFNRYVVDINGTTGYFCARCFGEEAVNY